MSEEQFSNHVGYDPSHYDPGDSKRVASCYWQDFALEYSRMQFATKILGWDGFKPSSWPTVTLDIILRFMEYHNRKVAQLELSILSTGQAVIHRVHRNCICFKVFETPTEVNPVHVEPVLPLSENLVKRVLDSPPVQLQVVSEVIPLQQKLFAEEELRIRRSIVDSNSISGLINYLMMDTEFRIAWQVAEHIRPSTRSLRELVTRGEIIGLTPEYHLSKYRTREGYDLYHPVKHRLWRILHGPGFARQFVDFYQVGITGSETDLDFALMFRMEVHNEPPPNFVIHTFYWAVCSRLGLLDRYSLAPRPYGNDRFDYYPTYTSGTIITVSRSARERAALTASVPELFYSALRGIE